VSRFDRASSIRCRVSSFLSPLFFHDQAKTTVLTRGDHPPPGCLPTCRLPSGRKDQTVRRARPLALRRAMTLRPFLVLMRFRNPCSRLRLRFEGCLKVNDIAHSFSRNHFAVKRPHYRGATGGCQSICPRIPATKSREYNPKSIDRESSSNGQAPECHQFLRHSCPIAAKMPQQTVSWATECFLVTSCSREAFNDL
jgi:hypothetical protein